MGSMWYHYLITILHQINLYEEFVALIYTFESNTYNLNSHYISQKEESFGPTLGMEVWGHFLDN